MKKSNALGLSWRASLAAAGVIWLSCSTGGVALAQAPAAATAKGQQSNKLDVGATAGAAREIAKAEGKLEAQQGQTIKISTAEKKELFIQLSQGTALKYSGEADRSWLAPGLMVRFSTKFEQGKPPAPLKNLDVFMPAMRPGMTMEQMREQTPGMYQEGKVPPPGAKGLFAEDNKKPGTKAGGKPADPPATASGASPTYRVVGRISGVHGNTLIVAAEQPMQFELDPAAVISVSSSDLSFAQLGDTVAVSGLRNPVEPAFIQAEKLEIKAAKKLTQAQPTTQRGGRTRSKQRVKAADAGDLDAKGGAAGGQPGTKADGKNSNPNDKRPGSTKKPTATNRSTPTQSK